MAAWREGTNKQRRAAIRPLGDTRKIISLAGLRFRRACGGRAMYTPHRVAKMDRPRPGAYLRGRFLARMPITRSIVFGGILPWKLGIERLTAIVRPICGFRVRARRGNTVRRAMCPLANQHANLSIP